MARQGVLFSVDLAIAVVDRDARLVPMSVHGLLWLQTHFDTSQWESVCSGRARLHSDGITALCRDARDAGLRVTQASA
jgi:hypothetical protein